MTSLQGKRAAIAICVAACAVAVAGAATLGGVLSQRPVLAPEATQKAPANPAGPSIVEPLIAGCWELTLTKTELAARWVLECALSTPAELGVRAWHSGTIRLPAAAGEPKMARAQVHASFSEALAQRGAGALLFLPTTSTGAGYYVAAWAVSDTDDVDDVDDADGEVRAPVLTRGLQVGRYGAPPVSVATPVGRIYLQPDFAPGHALARNARQELEPDDTPHAADGPAGMSSEAPPAPTSQADASEPVAS